MWKLLTINDLRKILSEDEVDKLNKLSLENSLLEQVINQTILMISNTWRGALKGQSYVYDIRDGYTPPEYEYYILVHARHAIWSRFPQSRTIALDDARTDEYKYALKLLEKPFIDVSRPDDEHASDKQPDEQDDSSVKDIAVRCPPMKFEPLYTMGYSTPFDMLKLPKPEEKDCNCSCMI